MNRSISKELCLRFWYSSVLRFDNQSIQNDLNWSKFSSRWLWHYWIKHLCQCSVIHVHSILLTHRLSWMDDCRFYFIIESASISRLWCLINTLLIRKRGKESLTLLIIKFRSNLSIKCFKIISSLKKSIFMSVDSKWSLWHRVYVLMDQQLYFLMIYSSLIINNRLKASKKTKSHHQSRR